MEGYATPKQLCGFYKLSKSFIYDLLAEMEKTTGGVLRIGRAVRVKVSNFDEFLKKRMEAAE